MPASSSVIEEANAAKADFDEAYNQPDPRAYFRTLRAYEYQIPERANSVFCRVLDNLGKLHDLTKPTVVDVGCSYGINAALLKFGLSLDDLYARYADPAIADMTTADLLREDRDVYSCLPQKRPLDVLGLDIASQALAYGEAATILDQAMSCDLEARAPTADERAVLAHTDLIISTGCVGYVTDATFGHIVEAVDGGRPPWVAAFVLRMFPYGAIARRLARYGLVTAKLTGRTFVQRRFVDEEEQLGVLSQLSERGLTVTGLEDRGYLHAEFFLSVPEADARTLELQTPWQVVAQP